MSAAPLLYPTVSASRTGARRRRARLVTTRLVRLVREDAFPAPESAPEPKAPIRCPRDAYALMAPFCAREVAESFWILALDSQHRLATAGPTVITRGILNSSLVHPREVFLAAITARAAALVLVHNHPSGDPTPSADDRLVTEQLVAAGRLLDIPVHDHIIVGAAGRFTSFAEAGWI